MAEPEVALKPYAFYSGYTGYDAGLEDSMYGARGAAFPTSPAYTISGEEKPAKKTKIGASSGGIISRFLNSATVGYERRGTRLGPVGF